MKIKENKKAPPFKLPCTSNVNFNLKDYYKVYQNDFSNDFFKFKITALSNYEYINNSDKKDYNLFIEDENSLLKKEFKISGLKINDFGIIKNYNIDNNDISVFNNNLETGLIKLELLQGFGSKIYNKVLNRISVEATSKTLKKGELKSYPYIWIHIKNIGCHMKIYSLVYKPKLKKMLVLLL